MNLTPPAKAIVTLIRTHHLTYDTFRNACHAARAYLKSKGELKPKRTGKSLPKLLPEVDLQRYWDIVVAANNLKHEILLKLLFYTAIRNEELTNIRLDDVDVAGSRIFIDDGKGGKDRYVLFPESFRSLLRAYIASVPDNTYLFESSHNKAYSTRRIHQIVSGYGKQIGLHVHPHTMRHQMLTHLKKSGLDDAQIQLVSGHSSRKSLEIYTHLGLSDVSSDYQTAVKKLEIP